MNNVATIIGGTIAIVAVVGATVAVCLGHISASDYQGIIGVALGAGVGIGAHAAGVKQGTP
jgi:hypothetical protein